MDVFAKPLKCGRPKVVTILNCYRFMRSSESVQNYIFSKAFWIALQK